MKEELEKLVVAGKIGRQHVEALLQLTQSGYCTHRSWGFGRITTVDTVFSRLVVDFQGKPGHSLDLRFAAESLKPIPADHILARKVADLNSLRQMAVQHLDLIRLVLQSYGGKATAGQIQQVLVPEVIADDWKKWWEVARREMKKDGHFLVPLKKSEPIVYQETEVPVRDRLLGEFRAAKGLKARLVVTQEILKSIEDLGDKVATVDETLSVLTPEIVSHQVTQPALALEAIFMREDLHRAAGQTAQPGDLHPSDVWNQPTLKLATVFEQVPAAKHRQALQSFRETFPDRWHELLLGILNSVSAKLCAECAHLLIHEGKLDPLKDLLARLISQHNASSELLLWLAKERSDSFADILGPEVFRSMLTAMERDQFLEKKSNRLRDYILDDHDLIADLIESADIEVVKDLTRALQFSPSFDDMDRRSLLGRIVKIFPSIQALISGEQTRQDTSPVVSWESLERRKNEYTELVRKKIPANSRDIAVARSYGDLRENHEYKAAKETHRLLMRRKHELELQLARARGISYAEARTDVVSIGNTVRVVEVNTQSQEEFSVLGAWDSDAEKGHISYLSPFGQCLLNHKVGDEVEFEIDGVRKRYRIDSIALYAGPAAADLAPGETALPANFVPEPPLTAPATGDTPGVPA